MADDPLLDEMFEGAASNLMNPVDDEDFMSVIIEAKLALVLALHLNAPRVVSETMTAMMALLLVLYAERSDKITTEEDAKAFLVEIEDRVKELLGEAP